MLTIKLSDSFNHCGGLWFSGITNITIDHHITTNRCAHLNDFKASNQTLMVSGIYSLAQDSRGGVSDKPLTVRGQLSSNKDQIAKTKSWKVLTF